MSPVQAMTRCPEAPGPKDPFIDILGWALLSLGVFAGLAFAAFVIRRTRSMPLRSRLIAALGGIAGMLLIWLGGAALAVSLFIQC